MNLVNKSAGAKQSPGNDRRSGVALVISDLGSGGAQQVVSQLANHWAGQGRRVGVLTFAGEEQDFFALAPNVERLIVGSVSPSQSLGQKLTGNFTRIRALRNGLKTFGGDTAIAFIGPTNILLILASLGLGYRTIISERNNPARQSFGRIWDLLRRRFYARADIVSANSQGALDAMRPYVPAAKLAYLPNPLRVSIPHSTPPVRRQNIILNVGRLHWQKGQDILIRAFAPIAGDLPDWRLCIVGEGEQRVALEALISQLSLQGRVELLGRIADPFPWYRKAGIFAFPSRWEGSPNALMEALSCGLPCVVSDFAPGQDGMIRHGEDGLVVTGESPDALSKTLFELAKNAKLRDRLGQNAAARLRNRKPEAAFQAWDKLVWSQEETGS